MLIARSTQFDFLVLQQTATVADEPDENEDDDAMDFDMI
jgi:hypothetical protein